jgi:predicted transcriptional regulator of viral defense system
MKWLEFLNIVSKLPVIDTENLFTGISDPSGIEVQISRWVKAGKIIQLRRGIYLLAEPYRRTEPYDPYIAAILRSPSYISLEKALEYHDLIPEAVNVYTCVTTKRKTRYVTEAGIFDYRYINKSLFWGYESVTVNRQTAFFASREKAILDLFYINRLEITLKYLEGLRLQNVENISIEKLFEYARRFNKPKILSAARVLKDYIKSSGNGEIIL